MVIALGTGGTVSGAGRYLHEQRADLVIVGADPDGSVYAGGPVHPYLTEGIGEDFWPGTYDTDVCDLIVRVTDRDSFLTARAATAAEGILVGESSGTALWAALQVARDVDDPDALFVVLLPDSGRNYIGKLYNDAWLRERRDSSVPMRPFPTTTGAPPGPRSSSAANSHVNRCREVHPYSPGVTRPRPNSASHAAVRSVSARALATSASTTGSAASACRPGTSGRATEPVYNPATGEVAREVDFASVEEVDAAVATAKAAFPAWRATSLSRRTEIMFRIRNLVDQHRTEIAAHLTAEHGKVHTRRHGRGRPRRREPRVRDRHPAPAEGHVQRAGERRNRRVPDPPAAGRGGRDHPVQLPGHGPHVDVRQRHRMREHLHPEAIREGPVRFAVRGRAPRRSRAAGRSLQRDQRGPDRGGSDPGAPRHRIGQLRGIHPGRAPHLRDRHPPRQAGPGPGWSQEPHGRPARRRHRHGRRCGRVRRLWLGRRAVHGHQRGRGRG